jgi:enoyl-CoA hydratase/carnithine racemase
VSDPAGPDAFETLRVETPAPHVLQITMDRPQVTNAFNTAMAEELVTVFEARSTATDDIRVVLLTGAGDRAFCAGGDLKERDGMSDAQWAAQHLVFERMLRAVLACPVPVLGAINGAAYGGGCELAAAVDIAQASEPARFAQTEVRIGIIPGAGGTQTLARKIGTARAMEVVLSARAFTAREALDWGLVTAVHPPEALMPAMLRLAREIAANAPIATRAAKVAIATGAEMPLAEALRFEIACYNQTFVTEDRREGVAAFNEKRAPVFKGR